MSLVIIIKCFFCGLQNMRFSNIYIGEGTTLDTAPTTPHYYNHHRFTPIPSYHPTDLLQYLLLRLTLSYILKSTRYVYRSSVSPGPFQ